MSTLHINPWRIFVAGATGVLGMSVVHALVQMGAEVTALVPPGAFFRLNTLGGRVQLVEGDAWSPGALVGRSRGHGTVIHLVGSLRQQPERGLTYDYLNVTSLRNIARMATRDGAPHLMYLSAARTPWLPGGYIESKREAEAHVRRCGLDWTIIRAPLVYPRGHLRNPVLMFFAGLSAFPLFGAPFRRWGPLPVEVMARGLARLALNPDTERGRIVRGGDLRRLGAGRS